MTIQNFIHDELSISLEEIFKEINNYVFEKDAVNRTHAYIDGTKIEANANKYTWVWKKRCILKHLSDKWGAHIDIGHFPIVEMVNAPITGVITPVLCIAIQTIWAVKHQVPELANYWPEMELPEELIFDHTSQQT